MALIFLNYRRLDSGAISRRLASKLKEVFGDSQVFIDVDDMEVGVWDEQLKQKIESAKIFLVVIGPKWLKIANEETGQRRLDEEDDIVRREIEFALKYKKMIINILVDSSKLPTKNMLPVSIQNFAPYQCIEVRDNDTRTFDTDFNNLVAHIKKAASEKTNAHEETLHQLGQALISSKHDLDQYNIARATLLSYIRGNRQVNGNTLRLIQAHVALTIALYLQKLKVKWNSRLGDKVRRVAVDNTIEITNPFNKNQIADFIHKGLNLDEDPDLTEALENGLSYALPMDKIPASMLRFGIGMAYNSAANVINSIKVLDKKLPTQIKNVTEQIISESIIKIEDDLRKQWFLK